MQTLASSSSPSPSSATGRQQGSVPTSPSTHQHEGLAGRLGHAFHAATHVLEAPDADLRVSDSETDDSSTLERNPATAGLVSSRRRARWSRRTSAPLPSSTTSSSAVRIDAEPGIALQAGGHQGGRNGVLGSASLHCQDVETQPVEPTLSTSDDAAGSVEGLTSHTDNAHLSRRSTATWNDKTHGSNSSKQPSDPESYAGDHHHHHHHHQHLEQHADETREQAFFDRAHSSSGKYVAEMGPQVPLKFHHLFKPPMIRQWVHGSHYFGEVSERGSSRGELLFDLVFVGVIHKLSDSLAEAPTRVIQLALFSITFFLAWTLWLDQRMLINQSGSDDIWQRAYLVLMMILANAFISNASGVKITTMGGDSEGTGSPNTAAEAIRLLGRALLNSRAEHGGAEEVKADSNAYLFED